MMRAEWREKGASGKHPKKLIMHISCIPAAPLCEGQKGGKAGGTEEERKKKGGRKERREGRKL